MGRIRLLSTGALVVVALCVAATAVSAQDFLVHAPAAPAARMRKLAKLSGKSRTCEPGNGRVCAVSGMRIHDGSLWLVMDGATPSVARAAIPRSDSGKLDLSGPFRFTVYVLSKAAQAQGCKGFGDAEGLSFDRQGRLVLTTDRWQLARATLEGGTRPRVEWCKQFKPLLPSNRGFEAVFVTAAGVHIVSENEVDGKFRLYTEPAKAGGARREAGFRWDLAACKTGKLRITDAVGLKGGALLLASCKTWQEHRDYFLGRLRVRAGGSSAELTFTTRIANPKQRNLEAVALTPDGRILVVNDDSQGTERRGTTKLWEVLIPRKQRTKLTR